MSTNTLSVARRNGTQGAGWIHRTVRLAVIAGLALAIIFGLVVILDGGTASGSGTAIVEDAALNFHASHAAEESDVLPTPAKPISAQRGMSVRTQDGPVEVAEGNVETPVTPRVLFPSVAPPSATDSGCAGGYTSDDLNGLIHDAASGAGGIIGADYARAQVLPDGRVLWVFQDVFVGGAGGLGNASFMHNAGLIQNGSCFELLRGAGGGSWIGGDVEDPLDRWFWPLDSVIDADGRLAQFVVEMRNPNGSGAFEGAEPVAVWIATISLGDFTVVDLQPAPDSGDRPLYGFSITSHGEYDYLYGNCYRQFADPGYAGFLHDTECGPLVYVARVPVGHPEATPQYWAGASWSPERSAATPIARRGDFANPMQVRRMGELFVSVTKVDDWWGNTIVIEAATSPQGPFIEVESIDVPTLCEACNTYFAQLLPWTDPDGAPLVVISNNAWDMRRDAYPRPELYRPSVLAITTLSGFELVGVEAVALR